LLTENFERGLKEGSGKGAYLSAGALLGEPGGRLLCWGSGRILGGGLRGQASLSIKAPLGNMEGGSSARDFERWMKGTVEVSIYL
jgi:hypothetical protein